MAIGRSANGRLERQRILNHLLAHGAASCRQISDALGVPYRTTIGRIEHMRTHKELAAESRDEGNKKILYFTPLVALTVAQFPSSNTHASPRPKPTVVASKQYTAVTTCSPGHVRHNGMNRDHPIPKQGGQGGVSGPRVATYLETMA